MPKRVKAWLLIAGSYMWSIPLLRDLWNRWFPPPGRGWDAQAGIASAITLGWGLLLGLLVAGLLQLKERSRPGISLAVGKALAVLCAGLFALTVSLDPGSLLEQLQFLLLMGLLSPVWAALSLGGMAEALSKDAPGLARTLAPDALLLCVTLLLTLGVSLVRKE